MFKDEPGIELAGNSGGKSCLTCPYIAFNHNVVKFIFHPLFQITARKSNIETALQISKKSKGAARNAPERIILIIQFIVVHLHVSGAHHFPAWEVLEEGLSVKV